MTIDIRPYQSPDLNDLLSSWERASRLAHGFMPESFFDQERHNIPSLYLPNADTWVAVVEHRVVGFIALIGNEVGGLFVDPQYHGTGCGKALMDKAQVLHGELEVRVFHDNVLGRRFYRHYGFVVVGEEIFEPTSHRILRMVFEPEAETQQGITGE